MRHEQETLPLLGPRLSVAVPEIVHAGRPEGSPMALTDFGDVTSGDPTSDLAAAYLLFDARGASAFVDEMQRVRPQDDATWQRARAWALRLALAIGLGPQNALRRECGRVLADLLD